MSSATSSSRSLRMPKSIDEPDQILLWSFEEFMVVAVLFGLGIVFAQLMVAMGSSYFFLKIFRRYREGRPTGFMQHIMYWSGLRGLETTTVRNPFIRRFFS